MGALLFPSVAVGQPIAQAPDAADQAFQQGRALFAKGNIEQACDLFATSYELRPRHGTLLNLAVCLEQKGDEVAAVSRFQESLAAAVSDGRADRIELAKSHLEKLMADLSTITIRLQGAEPPGLRVSCDGHTLGAAWREPIRVKAGTHLIAVDATGRPAFEQPVTVVGGTSKTVEVPALTELAAPEAARAAIPVSSSPISRSRSVAARPAEPELAPQAWRRPVAIPLLALGLISLAVGGVLGYRALSDGKEIDHLCGDGRCSTTGNLATAERLDVRAHTEARVADLTLPIGAAALAVGAYLLWPRPAPSPKALRSTRFEIGASAARDAVTAHARATW